MTAARPARSGDKPTTILLVDDEHQALKYFARLFSSEFEVLTCSSADEALQLFEQRQGQISVIVSDHRMPVTTGVALLSAVREKWPDTVRLLTTAFADTDSLAASINDAAVHRYIAKPWDLDALRQVLEDASRTYSEHAGPGTAPAAQVASSTGVLPPLVGVVAHELATPLLSIEMTSKSILNAVEDQLAASQPAQNSDVHKSLETFARAARRIGEDAARARRLARSLAELARDTTARSAFMRVSMATCVQRAVDSFPYQGRERSLVTVNLSEDFVFVGTDVLMTAVITNVLSNALEAVRGEPQPEIGIELKRGAPYNSVIVRDSGPGVPQSIDGQEFQPFVSGKQNGTGLGLAICDWIVKSFGGLMRLNSEDAMTEVEIQIPHPMPQAAR